MEVRAEMKDQFDAKIQEACPELAPLFGLLVKGMEKFKKAH